MEKNIITVTGGTGYIASWIVKYLLEKGHEVRITVRSKSDVAKYQHLLDIERDTTGKLLIYEADLLKDGSFDEAVNGADYVMHTASPFFLDDKGDTKKKLVDPAVKGTENLLNSVNKASSVKRVILTSSIAAIFGDNRDLADNNAKAIDESMWNTTASLTHNAYSYSKTEAEKKAWEVSEKQNRWDLVTINPGFVLGPSLTKRVDSTSINSLLRILRGDLKAGSPDLEFLYSDVRDIANAHILAAFTKIAKGRYIISNESGNLLKVAKYIEEEYPGKYRVPKGVVPKFIICLLAPTIGFTRKFVRNNVGFPLKGDNRKSINELNMCYKSLKETVLDHVKQIESDNLI